MNIAHEVTFVARDDVVPVVRFERWNDERLKCRNCVLLERTSLRCTLKACTYSVLDLVTLHVLDVDLEVVLEVGFQNEVDIKHEQVLGSRLRNTNVAERVDWMKRLQHVPM